MGWVENFRPRTPLFSHIFLAALFPLNCIFFLNNCFRTISSFPLNQGGCILSTDAHKSSF